MLTGQYNHTVDSKGRVFIPAKFRTDLGQHVTISIIFGKYICVYADSEWEKFIEKLDAFCAEGKLSEKNFRLIMSSAQNVEVDSQGRIIVGENQRNHAGILKDVTFIGMRNHAELWSSEVFEAEEKISEAELEEFKQISATLHLGLG